MELSGRSELAIEIHPGVAEVLDNRPSWVGHTTRPAFFWFRHREVRRQLEALGFSAVNRWSLRTRELSGWKGALVRAAAANRAVRLAADVAVPGVEYLALKP